MSEPLKNKQSNSFLRNGCDLRSHGFCSLKRCTVTPVPLASRLLPASWGLLASPERTRTYRKSPRELSPAWCQWYCCNSDSWWRNVFLSVFRTRSNAIRGVSSARASTQISLLCPKRNDLSGAVVSQYQIKLAPGSQRIPKPTDALVSS